ncbi:Uncharacterized protein Adt_43960 [Abeliophyllum distichum]|uniref:Bromo domain-containing protein n=1 Tax=Abeliophyllum distichum TaxID=126358 RepID=A0ABD1P9J5_9LAMI
MKRKRDSGRRKPMKPSTSGAAQIFVNPRYYSDKDEKNGRFDARMESETRHSNADMSGPHACLEKEVAHNGTVGSAAAKLARALYSSCAKHSRNEVTVQADRDCEKQPKSPRQDPRYYEHELNAALLVIKKIMKMDAAIPFNVPVDPIALEIPDYFDVIDTPMDFGTICSNLENGLKYVKSEDVFKDVQCIWDNCCKYNKKGSYILELMKRVKNNFMKHWTTAKLYKEPLNVSNGHMNQSLESPVESTTRHNNAAHECQVDSTIGNYTHLQQQDFTCLNQRQPQQLSPCCRHAHKPQQISFQCGCPLHSGQLQPCQPQNGTHVSTSDSVSRHNDFRNLCSAELMDSNSFKQCPSLVHSDQPSPSCNFICNPRARNCLLQLSSTQLAPSQVQAGINVHNAGNFQLPTNRESTSTFHKCENACSSGPNTGKGKPTTSVSDGLSLWSGSSSFRKLRPCTSAATVHLSPVTEFSGNLHTAPPVESTVNCSRPGIECPVTPVTHNTSTQQIDQMGPTQEQSSSMMNNTECNPQKYTCHNLPGPSSSQPSSPIETNNRSTDYSSARRKSRGRGRGPTRCLQLLSEKRISITTNALGQPIGHEAPKLTSFLGILARNGNLLPLTYVDWRAVPNESKESLWQKVQSRFDIDPVSKGWVLQSLGRKWKDWKSKLKSAHYYPHETDEERLANCDERVLPDQWASLIVHWSSETEERAKRSDGKEPSRAELFILTRTCRNGQPVNEASAAVIMQLQGHEKQQETSQNSTTRDDTFSRVLGKDKHGRVRCYGLGSSPSDLGVQKPTREEALKMVSDANVEIREMKEKMAAMEQTCAQMATQMTDMMSMMSSMRKIT